jgi:hypothetical protein
MVGFGGFGLWWKHNDMFGSMTETVGDIYVGRFSCLGLEWWYEG